MKTQVFKVALKQKNVYPSVQKGIVIKGNFTIEQARNKAKVLAKRLVETHGFDSYTFMF